MEVDQAPLLAITGRLDRVRQSIRRLYLFDGAGRVLLALAAFILVTFLFDWFFILPRSIRVLFLLSGLSGLAWMTARRIVFPARVGISDDDIAIFVERHFPDLNDRLISALQLTRELNAPSSSPAFNSPELVGALVDDAARAASSIDFDQVVVRTHVRKITTAAAVAAMVLVAGVVASPGLAGTYLARILGGNARWPQRTYIRMLDFDANHRRVVARGDDLTIAVALVKGDKPRKVTLAYTFDSGEHATERMAEVSETGAKDKTWTYIFPHVSGPFRVVVEGGDDRSDEHFVDVNNPPSLSELKLFFEFPEYLGIPPTAPDRPEAAANLSVPQFTKVRFEALSNEDLEKATLTIGTKEKQGTSTLELLPDAQKRNRVVKGSFEVIEPYGEVDIALKALNGLANRDPIHYTVKGAPDLKPQVAVLDPSGDETATEVCERPLTIETKDDHGLRQVAVEGKVVGAKSTDWYHAVLGAAHNRPPDYGRQVDKVKSEYLLKIGELGVKAGEFVVVRIHAEDFKDVGDANVTKSKEIRFTIVPVTVLEKELQDAIDKIKQTLEGLKRRQQAGYDRSGALDRKFGAIEKLGAEQSGEVKSAALEQNDITSKLDASRKDVERVTRRGVYNKIFDEQAAAELEKASAVLKTLADTSDSQKPAWSSLAASYITQAARASVGADRRREFAEAQAQQSAVIKGIQDALRYLDRWANYQEVVRMTREILEEQKRVNDAIKNLIK